MTVIKPLIPSSKSYTQRSLILAALVNGKSKILNPLECDDSYHLRNALRELSATIDDTNPDCWTVQGLDQDMLNISMKSQPSGSCDGTSPPGSSDNGVPSIKHKKSSSKKREAVHCWSENAGTVLRFISAFSLILNRPIIIDGNRRLRQRPLHRLIQTLESAGISSRFIADNGSLPLFLEKGDARTLDTDITRNCKKGRKGKKKKRLPEKVSHETENACKSDYLEISVDPSMTSQLLSGLLMVSPLFGKPVVLKLTHESVSGPYVEMTLKAMADFGFKNVKYIDDLTIKIEPGSYSPSSFTVEKDWSSAATMLTAAWLTCTAIDADDLNTSSLQGDKAIVSFLDSLSNDEKHIFNITDCPDIIGPLTIAALFAKGETLIEGINHTKIKECDRPATLCRELSKIGANIFEEDNLLRILPLSQESLLKAMGAKELVLTDHIILDPEDDHRMAMAFGLLSLKIPYLAVKTRECVSKSFSRFWENLELFRE